MKAYKITGKLGDICSFRGGENVKKGDLVYSTPQPQREWVGLTEEEIQQVFIANSVMVDNGNTYMVAGLRAVNIGTAIEAKLKEKNSAT
jgi:hypothetical protein